MSTLILIPEALRKVLNIISNKSASSKQNNIIHKEEVCKGKSRRDLYTSDETILPSISNQETETFNYKNEEQGGQRTTLSDSSRGTKELRGSTIN